MSSDALTVAEDVKSCPHRAPIKAAKDLKPCPRVVEGPKNGANNNNEEISTQRAATA